MEFELSEEQRMLKDMVHRLADDVFRPLAARWDEHADPPLPNLKVLTENGLTGITIPVEYGGSGGIVLDAVLAIEEISRVCSVTTAMILGNCANSEIILKFGTEEQKRKYLPPIAEGKTPVAWGMTEPQAGSAATDLKTKAVPEGDYYILNGTKIFISRAQVSDIFIIFARVGESPGSKAICSFLVEKGTPGNILRKGSNSEGSSVSSRACSGCLRTWR